MNEITKEYEKEFNDKIEILFDSSDKLADNIINGGVADIFIPASETQMNLLKKKNLVEENYIKNLLKNEIVLVVEKKI